jgi:glycosyltransferase involved in cell wall biosynthesis
LDLTRSTVRSQFQERIQAGYTDSVPMTVSAVIPTFNRLPYIRRAIESVLAQTVPVDEVLVIDDGSTDGTADALEAAYGTRIRVVRQANTGVSGARRRGVQEARGEWIAFLDSDDVWTTNHNKELLDAAARVPEDVAWIFGDMRVVRDEGNQSELSQGKGLLDTAASWQADAAWISGELGSVRVAGSQATLFETYRLSVTDCPEVLADSLSVLNPILCFFQGSIIRRRVLLELDCFGAGLRSWEDMLVGYQVACRYRLAAIPSVVANYYRTADLALSSVSFQSFSSPDHFRAKMIAYALVIESGRSRPWNDLYEGAVRSLCRALVHKGQPVPRTLAMQQFRFGAVSAKGIAFFCAAMFGRRGIQLWSRIAEARMKSRIVNQANLVNDSG